MSRLVVTCFAAVPLAAAALFACSSFSSKTQENPTNEAGASRPSGDSGGPIVEAGAGAFSQSAAEYDVALDDGGTLHCWNFGLTIGNFVIDGESAVTYHADQGGYLISIDDIAPDFAQIYTTIDAGKPIHATTLRIDERVTISGSFDAGIYTDGFAQYLGGLDDNVARNAIVYAPEGAEIDAWPHAGYADAGFDSVLPGQLPLGSVDGPVWIDTTWAPDGNVTISAAGKVAHSTHGTTTDPPASTYTLKIGGQRHGDTRPTVDILVRSICIGFR